LDRDLLCSAQLQAEFCSAQMKTRTQKHHAKSKHLPDMAMESDCEKTGKAEKDIRLPSIEI
jgi:hypothetical protein